MKAEDHIADRLKLVKSALKRRVFSGVDMQVSKFVATTFRPIGAIGSSWGDTTRANHWDHVLMSTRVHIRNKLLHEELHGVTS